MTSGRFFGWGTAIKVLCFLQHLTACAVVAGEFCRWAEGKEYVMKRKRLLTVASAYVLVAVVVAFTGPSCGAETPKKEQLPTFVEGSTAYIRVKEYAAKPLEDATPKGAETTLNFGQTVKLIQQKDGPPTMWLVSMEKGPAWVPSYLLTVNKAEIAFLKKNDRIPATMTFIYKKDDIIKVWGLVRLGFLVVDSQGLATSADGSSQVAFKGNGVLFDESAVKHAWKNPMIFSKGNTTYKVKSACLYYCVAVDDTGNGSFDCIDLTTLTFCK